MFILQLGERLGPLSRCKPVEHRLPHDGAAASKGERCELIATGINENRVKLDVERVKRGRIQLGVGHEGAALRLARCSYIVTPELPLASEQVVSPGGE